MKPWAHRGSVPAERGRPPPAAPSRPCSQTAIADPYVDSGLVTADFGSQIDGVGLLGMMHDAGINETALLIRYEVWVR